MQTDIEGYLTKIKSQLSSFRSKVSRVLRELEEFLFTQGNILADETIQFLLVGSEPLGLKGLMALCGVSGKFSDSLKNSSNTAISLIWRLLSESRIKPSYLTLLQPRKKHMRRRFQVQKLSSLRS